MDLPPYLLESATHPGVVLIFPAAWAETHYAQRLVELTRAWQERVEAGVPVGMLP